MAMFDFLKKKESAPPPLAPPAIPGETPTEYVASMQQQGLSNNQIIQILQRQGYNQTQVYDALNQAALKSTITGGVPIAGSDIVSPLTPPSGLPFAAEPAQGPRLGPVQAPPSGLPPFIQPGREQLESRQGASFEELAESIIEEKWRELQKRLDKDREWRENSEIRIGKIEQQILDVRNELDNLHKAIVSKIGDYDKSLLSVGTEIRAMEKVFQKILPELTENVSELSRITKTAKAKK
ncbi:hypothetical protein HY641_03250 [Candidatus Woesearchaeota archaeon]|nr:hypothetical protein [Candidatus Woesearchaeota archaeon]